MNLLGSGLGNAHDKWSDGEDVPEWVKSTCCGKADAHHVKVSSVHLMQDGYHIDGLGAVIPIDKALPSMDGQYWGFWNNVMDPKDIHVVYCFFAPVNGT